MIPLRRRGYMIDDGCTVLATETRPELNTKEPYSRLEPRVLTGPAWHYHQLVHGDSGDMGGLVDHLSSEISRHALTIGFDLTERASEGWAQILLKKHIGINIPTRKAAAILGLDNHNQYIRKYVPLEEDILNWIKSWAAQSRTQ